MRGRGWVVAGLVGFGLACMSGEEAPPRERPEAGDELREDRREGRRGARSDRGRAGRGGRGGAPAEDAPGAEPAPAPSPSPSPAPGGGSSDAAPSGIVDLGGGTWSVERRLVSKWEDNPAKLAQASQKGQGWELSKVKKGDAQHLGMLNGDVLKTVNGYGLGSPTELAIAYAALGDASKLTVKFKRDGESLTHVYKIVD